MANEIPFGHRTGATLKANVYSKAGAAKETNITMTETPANSGLYLGDYASFVGRDQVIIKQGSVPVGHGEYESKLIEHSSLRIVRNT